MNPMLQKIIAKKKAEGGEMSPAHKKAKSSVLSDLMEHLEGMGMDKVKGMKKVSVSSNSKEGLEQGLDKAKDIVGDESSMDEEGAEHEAMESPEMEASEHEEKSPEEMKQEIEELKAQLAAMKA